jgi:hypothetical protein
MTQFRHYFKYRCIILRYTENIGFDAVYYEYNSMNQIRKVMVVEQVRQYATWYGYDDNGRVDSVWTSLSAIDNFSDFGVLNYYSYPTFPPSLVEKPDSADIVYKYNKRGSVEEVIYPFAEVQQEMFYNPRGWLDSMVATQNYDVIFKQKLERNTCGNITRQISQGHNQSAKTQDYTFDR